MKPSKMSFFELPCIHRRGHDLNDAGTACRVCGLSYPAGAEVPLPIPAPDRRRPTPGLARLRGSTLRLAQSWGDRCFWCSEVLTDHTRSIDHVVPTSRGGSKAHANKMLACRRCNSDKADLMPLHYAAIEYLRQCGALKRPTRRQRTRGPKIQAIRDFPVGANRRYLKLRT